MKNIKSLCKIVSDTKSVRVFSLAQNRTVKYLFFVSFAMLFFSACSNEIDYVEPFPELTANLGEIKDIYYYSEMLTIDPVISYGSDTTLEGKNFSYQWSLTGDKGTKVISDERNLSFQLDSIGTLYLYYQIKDLDTDVIQIFSAEINVESVSNQGWYILKQTADGNTDIDGFYVSSDTPDYDIVTDKTGEPLEGAPVSFAFSPYYKWKETEDTTAYSTAAALLAFSKKDGIAFNVSNASVLSSFDDMFYLNSGTDDLNVLCALVSSDRVFITTDKGAFTMNNGNPAFFPAIDGDYRVDKFLTTGSYGSTLAFDNKNKRFFMFAEAGYYTSDTIGFFNDEYGEFNNEVEVPVNNMNGEPVFLGNTVRGSGYESSTYVYSLFKQDNVDDALMLYGLDYDKFVEGYYYYYPNANDYTEYTMVRCGEYSPVNFERTLDNNDYPMLTSAEQYAMNKVNNTLYFAKGGKIGMYNIDTEDYTESFISDISSDEEITFMKYITCNYETSDDDFDGLVVATYNTSTDTYKIYNYQLDGLSTVTLQDNIKSGTGKVEKVMYVSGSSYSWSSALFHYN